MFNKKFAFTLSEVLITIALIGFLATMTLSTIGASIQQRTRLAEFRAAYSKMETAIKNITVDTGKIPACYVEPTSDEIRDMGLIIDGTPGDSNNTGCVELERDFVRAMGTVRFCENDPITDGCIPDNYPAANSGCFTNYNSSKAYVLDNSMIIITNKGSESLKLFALDVNGRKGPNKWGQDIFPFSIKYTETKTLQGSTFVKAIGILPPNETSCKYAISETSKTTTEMMKESAGRKD